MARPKTFLRRRRMQGSETFDRAAALAKIPAHYRRHAEKWDDERIKARVAELEVDNG